MPTSLRHRARIVALQTLYELEFAANRVKDILDRNLQEREISGDMAEFAGSLVSGVVDNTKLLDETIGRFAKAFPVDQLAVMDRNILRLALFEIIITKEVPPKVAINEAVELAKEFGADTTPKFINGVLGSVISEIKKTA
ncbi:MAG: transcription antitermination factor NusB [Dehalococcoidia bacterium]|nr:MAG: transcription antitermination factor NusB [Dehalococcoidia bacterium]